MVRGRRGLEEGCKARDLRKSLNRVVGEIGLVYQRIPKGLMKKGLSS